MGRRNASQFAISTILDSRGAVVVEYCYDSWGNHKVFDANKHEITSASHIGNINPFRYRGYYYDTETKLYYLQSRYYDPETGRFLNMDSIVYANPETINGLNLYSYCGNNPVMGYDPEGTWDWGTFWKGLGMIITAVTAIALAVTTFGAGIPIAMSIVAGVTLGAGVLTGINGIATVVEAGTNYNFVRDGVFQGNETAYNWYSNITEGVAAVGSMVLGFYHATGQYKAAKHGQKFLGKGYRKAGTNRWVSSDGMRQFRLDKSHHMYKGNPSPTHFNAEYFKANYWQNARSPFKGKSSHIFYELFKFWCE